jgi:hypothetical protein
MFTGVLLGRLSWISYIKSENYNYLDLPKLKPGIFSPVILIRSGENIDIAKTNANLDYAKNYKISTDFKIIFKSLIKSIDFNFHSKQSI